MESYQDCDQNNNRTVAVKSNSNSTNSTISTNINIKKVGNYVKELKCRHKNTSNKLNEYLEENTKKEVNDLEEAMKRLNTKVDEIKETDYYNSMESKLEYYEEKIQKTMTNVLIFYKKAIKRIFKEYPDK